MKRLMTETRPSSPESAELMRAVDDALTSAGERLRASIPLSGPAIMAAREKALARLSDSAIPIRIGSLHLLLAPMCGVETSTRAIRAAADRASSGSQGRLEERLWPGFVEHLHVIVANLCGEPAAQLVWDRGMRLKERKGGGCAPPVEKGNRYTLGRSA